MSHESKYYEGKEVIFMKIEFWFDFASTYSYPSAMRIEYLAQKNNLEVVWRPFLLGPIFNKQGWNDSPFNIYQVKGEYMWKDLQRVCNDLDLPFKRPDKFPQNGLLAARIAMMFADAPWISSFIKSVFAANFAHNEDISSPAILSNFLTLIGENPEDIIKEANSDIAKDLLRQQTDEALTRSIFGAPSFLVVKELFWGDDRLERAIKWANDNRSH